MDNKGNDLQMALIQVSEWLEFTQMDVYYFFFAWWFPFISPDIPLYHLPPDFVGDKNPAVN